MRILFPTTLLPGMRRTGSEVVTQEFVDAIRDGGHDVTLLGYRRVDTVPPMGPGDVAVADRHIETVSAGPRPALWMLRALLTGRPYSVAKYVSRVYARSLREAIRAVRPELVVLDHAQMAWLVPHRGWDTPMAYLAHNVEHALHGELSGHGGIRAWAHRREGRRIRIVEQDLVTRATELWTLSADDAEVLDVLAPGTPSRVFDVPPATVPGAPRHAEHDVVVLGGWHWKPNAAGLRWFAEEVGPHLHDRGLEVVVGGASGHEIVDGRAGLRAIGPVPDALEFLQSGRVVVVPSTAGAGVQVKTLDAIASGRHVVATSVAMRGIAAPPPTVTTVDDPAAFAAAVVRGLDAGPDPAESERARAWACERSARFRSAVQTALADLAAGAS